MNAVQCPDDDAVVAFLERAGGPDLHRDMVAHFDACDACRQLLRDLAHASASDETKETRESRELGGRYVLLSALGAGAMGVVQAAFDRQLDRKVALKFLGATPGEDSTRAQARLQREAQALAKLAHPNVVTVHDVGVLGEEVYVAMELVVGVTLRDWLAIRPRAVGDVVGVLRQAGEGLAAAHAAGLVHRDFKPENVLVGDDGRVRVTDFGLARAAGTMEDPVGIAEATSPRLATLTETGVRAGTPAYMAPEQTAGEAPSARSDIYSFCVTLAEAVTGARPGGTTKRRAPAWLERAIRRGLRARPEERWPSMRALLDVLAKGPPLTPLRVLATVGVLAVAATLGALSHARTIAARAPPLCPAPEHAFDGVWDEARRARIEQVLTASGHAGALAYVLETLDGYERGWLRAEVDTCAATRVRGEQSERLLDLRMACLDDRRRSVGRTVTLLMTADASAVSHSVEVVSAVPGIEACGLVRSLEETAPPAPGAEAAVESAKVALDDVRGLFYTGKVDEARARVESAIVDMRRVGYAPLLGELLYWRGNIERDLGLDRACEGTLVEAGVQSLEARDDRTLAQVWSLLGLQLATVPTEARAWVEQAGAAIQRLGGDDALEGERLLSLGSVVPDRSERTRLLLRSRELLVKTRGADFYLVASVDQRLGNVALGDGRLDEAMAYHARSLALRRRLFGVEHEATLSSIFNVAEDAIAARHPAEARAALKELEPTLAARVPIARAWYAIKLGDIAQLEGDWHEALAQHRRATEIYEAQPEPQRPEEMPAYLGFGRNLLELDRPREAIAPLEAAARLGAMVDDADAADAWFELGRTYVLLGDASRGRELVSRARTTYVKNPDATDPAQLAKANAWLASHDAPATTRSGVLR